MALHFPYPLGLDGCRLTSATFEGALWRFVLKHPNGKTTRLIARHDRLVSVRSDDGRLLSSDSLVGHRVAWSFLSEDHVIRLVMADGAMLRLGADDEVDSWQIDHADGSLFVLDRSGEFDVWGRGSWRRKLADRLLRLLDAFERKFQR